MSSHFGERQNESTRLSYCDIHGPKMVKYLNLATRLIKDNMLVKYPDTTCMVFSCANLVGCDEKTNWVFENNQAQLICHEHFAIAHNKLTKSASKK